MDNEKNKLVFWVQAGALLLIALLLWWRGGVAVGAPGDDPTAEATRFQGDVTISDNLFVTATSSFSTYVSYGATTTDPIARLATTTPNNAVPFRKAFVVGTCADATTTPFAFFNPFRATSTAQLQRLSGINGASTIDISVGTTTSIVNTATTTSPNVSALLESIVIDKSVNFHLFSKNVGTTTSFRIGEDDREIFNMTENGATTSVDNLAATGSRLVMRDKIVVGPNEGIRGQIATQRGNSDPSGVISSTNGFQCTYAFEFSR